MKQGHSEWDSNNSHLYSKSMPFLCSLSRILMNSCLDAERRTQPSPKDKFYQS